MRALVRILRFVTLPFLVLSLLAFLGLGFGAAFVTSFTIKNGTNASITVAPVGLVCHDCPRRPLPLYMKVPLLPLPPFPAVGSGRFDLRPGASVLVHYDMDDIQISEIAVADGAGEVRQLVVNASPTVGQYKGPPQRLYEIDDLSKLPLASPAVQEAAEAAGRQPKGVLWIYAVLIGPPIAMALLSLCDVLLRKCRKGEPGVGADSR